jgi:hypothetical protein
MRASDCDNLVAMMSSEAGSAATARHAASPLTLLRKAAGDPRELAGKIVRLAAAIARYGDIAALDDRIDRLQKAGFVATVPTRAQLFAGGVDMLRFWISPAAADYYERQGIDYGFHQVLRFLDEPASLTDPVGLFSTRDGIIGHLMQVVHANPVYDLELLASEDGGLDELEAQLEQMLAGTHPRAASIGAIVEEADYHQRLLDFIRAWRVDPEGPSMLRENVESSESWRALDRTFGSLHGAFAYFARLPAGPVGAARHLLTVKRFQDGPGEG